MLITKINTDNYSHSIIEWRDSFNKHTIKVSEHKMFRSLLFSLFMSAHLFPFPDVDLSQIIFHFNNRLSFIIDNSFYKLFTKLNINYVKELLCY